MLDDTDTVQQGREMCLGCLVSSTALHEHRTLSQLQDD